MTSVGEHARRPGWLDNEPAEVQRLVQAIRTFAPQGTREFFSVITSSPAFVRANLEDLFSYTQASD